MNSRRNGSVLVAVLWCLMLLGVFVLGILHTTRLDLTLVRNHADSIQAYYLAVAGTEKAKALIYLDAGERKRAAVSHGGSLADAPEEFREVVLGRGHFSVVRHDENGDRVYGITDEESRLNINVASPQELLKLEGLLPEIAAGIADWRDRDDTVTEGGAETEYYASLRQPYLPRNDNIQTALELLQVRAMDPTLLLGEDANQNGLLDLEEDDGDLSRPPDNRDGRLDQGWAGSLCFDSQVRNENAAGQERVNVQEADEATLRTVRGISPEIARAIVAYRAQNRLENIADLLDVAAIQPRPNAPPNAPQPEGQPNGEIVPGGPPNLPGRGQPAGPKLIDEELFLEIADDVTTTSDSVQRGPVNVNTASFAVLRCLPGLTDELARAIIDYRASAGYLPNVAHLLRVPGFKQNLLKQLAPRVTARSETFRIISEGIVRSSGARKRIEVIVRLNRSTIETISYRENL